LVDEAKVGNFSVQSGNLAAELNCFSFKCDHKSSNFPRESTIACRETF
jgi:hypothetical protein